MLQYLQAICIQGQLLIKVKYLCGVTIRIQEFLRRLGNINLEIQKNIIGLNFVIISMILLKFHVVIPILFYLTDMGKFMQLGLQNMDNLEFLNMNIILLIVKLLTFLILFLQETFLPQKFKLVMDFL